MRSGSVLGKILEASRAGVIRGLGPGRSRLFLSSLLAVMVIGILSGAGPGQTGVTPARFEVVRRIQVNKPAFLEYAARERSTPAVDPSRGWVFVADRFGKILSVDTAGRTRWEIDLEGRVEAGVLLYEDRLFVATVRGRIVSIDAFSGEEVWSYQGNNELATTPTIAGGSLLIPSLSDTVLALDADTGEFLWFHRRPRPEGLTIRGAPRAVVEGRRVIAGFSDGSVVALDLEDGRVLWRSEVGTGEHKDVNAAPVIHDGLVFVASFAGSLHALDLSTGSERWTSSIGSGATRMARFEDGLLVGSPDRLASYRTSDGALQWETALTGGIPTEILVHGGWAFLGTEEGSLLAVSARSGKPVATFATGTGVAAAPAPAASGVWLWSNGGWLYRLAMPGIG